MAHGYAGVRQHGIARFADAFAAAGFVVLLHDHRSFGVSGGEPRQDIDPWRQIADWRRAISYLESRPEVDASRIGIWGSSYAGGHSLVLGATDRLESRSIEFFEKLASRDAEAPDHPMLVEPLDQLGNGRVHLSETEEDTIAQATQ
jgi:dienelactone hydrolase